MVTENIAAALSAIAAEVGAVGKGEVNAAQHFNYRGVDTVVNAVAPVLDSHHVTVRPVHVEHAYSQYETRNGAVMGHVLVTVTYRWQLGDEYLDTVALGQSADAGDKAAPKAMSVAYRTCILQTLHLPTDEPDPDSQVHQRAQPADGAAPIGMTRRMWATIGAAGWDYTTPEAKDELRAQMSKIVGREIASSKDLTRAETAQVITAMEGK